MDKLLNQRGNNIGVSNTQPKSPPTYNNNANSDFDFSGLSGNQNSPSKPKLNLQGPSQTNSRPIKPLSKPGQSNESSNSNYNFNQNQDIGSLSFSDTNQPSNDPFNF